MAIDNSLNAYDTPHFKMAKYLYDAAIKIVPFNDDYTEIKDYTKIKALKEEISPRKDDLWKVFLEYRNNPVVRGVIEGDLTFAGQLDDIVNGNHKNKIALNECLGLNFPHHPGVYVTGFGLLVAAILGYFTHRKYNVDLNPGEVDHTKRAFLIKWLPILAGGSIGGLAGYGIHESQIYSLSRRAQYLDGVYRLIKS